MEPSRFVSTDAKTIARIIIASDDGLGHGDPARPWVLCRKMRLMTSKPHSRALRMVLGSPRGWKGWRHGVGGIEGVRALQHLR